MDILTLNLTMEKLHFQGKHQIDSSFYDCQSQMTDSTDSEFDEEEEEEAGNTNDVMSSDDDDNEPCSVINDNSSRQVNISFPNSSEIPCLTSGFFSGVVNHPMKPSVIRTSLEMNGNCHPSVDFDDVDRRADDDGLLSDDIVTFEWNNSEEELDEIDWIDEAADQEVEESSNDVSDNEVCEMMRPCVFTTFPFAERIDTLHLLGLKRCPSVVSRISVTSSSSLHKRKDIRKSSVCAKGASTVIIRPNLDFDKMRKTSYRRKNVLNGIERVRLLQS